MSKRALVESFVISKENINKSNIGTRQRDLNPATDKRFKADVLMIRGANKKEYSRFQELASYYRTLHKVDLKNNEKRLRKAKKYQKEHHRSAGHLEIFIHSEEAKKILVKLCDLAEKIINDSELSQLLEKYDLPLAWKESVRCYVLQNRMPRPSYHCRLIVKNSDYELPDDMLWIEIDGFARVKDILERWEHIKAIKSCLPEKKNEESKCIERDDYLYLSMQNNTPKRKITEIWKNLKINQKQKKLIGKSKKYTKTISEITYKTASDIGNKDKDNRPYVYRNRLKRKGKL